MSNEYIFVLQNSCAFLFLYLAGRMGKEALITYIAASWLLANFFVLKEVELFCMNVTAADVYGIAATFGLALLQERYGRAEAGKAIQISFLLLIISTLFSQCHLLYIPSYSDTTHEAFHKILSPTPRLMIASISSFFISSRFDVALFQWFKKHTRLVFSLRSTITVTSVAVVDTALFTLFGLYGIVEKPLHIFLMSFVVKLIAALFTGSCMNLSSNRNQERKEFELD